MKRLILASLFLGYLAHATPPPPARWAVASRVELLDLSADDKARAGALLMGAVGLAHAFAPRPENLFAWSGPRDHTKSLRLILTDSRKVAHHPELADFDPRARSGAFVGGDDAGHTSVTIAIFVDKLPAGVGANAEAFAPLTVELALNVFGLVQTYLEHPVVTPDGAERSVDADFAHRETLEFLRRLTTSPTFKRMDARTRAAFESVRRQIARDLRGPRGEGCAPSLHAKGRLPRPPTRH